METLKNSNLGNLVGAGAFIWAAGIEDTFITDPWPATGRTLDEYELTQHYELWREDLDLLGQLGVPMARYGIPWHRIQSSPSQWDWSMADRSIDRLLELGIQPIVDLVHYGLPHWIQGAFASPDFPARMTEYAARAATRYRSRVYCYTPLNEPRVTAWYCGKIGWWPPRLKGWRGFLQVMMGVCAGIVETVHGFREVDPEILPIHVDATDLYETAEPDLKAEAAHRQEIVFLALDLITGRVTSEHSLYSWLLKHGVTEDRLAWFRRRRIEVPLIGMNLYPLFSEKTLKVSGGKLRLQMRYADASIIDRLAELYYRRYAAPLMVSETASLGSIQRRQAWLRDSVSAVKRVRERGIPLVGYTWWPIFALVTWAYRQGQHPPSYYLKQMGLWDLREVPGGRLERVPTSLVQEYGALVQQDATAMGGIRAAA